MTETNRQKEYGRGENVLAREKKKSVISSFIEQLNDPLIFILFVAASISMLLREFSDTAIILAVILMNAIVGVVQEGKAQAALDALKEMTSPKAVIREGNMQREIPAADLIPGDIVCLEAGRRAPADLKLTESVNLKMEEAALTGESKPVAKSAGDAVYMSTNVTGGRGEGVVTAIGMDTEIGKIARMIQNAPTETTPLQKRLGDLGKILSVISIVLCVILFLLAVWQHRNVMDMLITAISLAVAAVPEGLPAIVTMVLALSVSRMVNVNVIVKRLPSVETLGCVSVVCSDKTGTLTQNRMTVTRCYADGRTGSPLELEGRGHGEFMRGFLLCNDAKIVEGERFGDPTELALIDMTEKCGVERGRVEREYPRIQEIPFDSSRKRMTTMHKKGDSYISYMKGSPDEVMSRCTHIYKNGNEHPFDKKERDTVQGVLSEFTGSALRVLALAVRYAEGGGSGKVPSVCEEGFTFLGLVGMEDPLRFGTPEAVRELREAGVKTIMITGDRMDTAFAIAKQLRIASRREECISGEELDEMSEEELDRRLDKLAVLAHVSPEHKVRIVSALKRNGKIVAMTGDGVNDAPSLKSADIGIAMGMEGTDVAKNAADLVLTDDNFATITRAVEQGRCIYENIKKSVLFLLSSNLGEIVTMLAAIACGFASPLKSSHILWINLITDSLPALALGVDVEENKYRMKRPPREAKEGLFAGGGMSVTLFYGFLIAFISMTAFLQLPLHILAERGIPFSLYNLRVVLMSENILSCSQTYAFTVLGMSQLFHAVGMRDTEISVFRMNHWKNKLMIVAFAVGIMLQLLVTEIPYFVGLFGTDALSGSEWINLLILAAMPLLAHEVFVLLKKLAEGKQD